MSHADAPTFGFPAKLLDALACPRDGARLELESGAGELVADGRLRCSRCQTCYPIADGVACFLEQQPSPMASADTERELRDAAAARYDAKLAGRWHKEVPATLRHCRLAGSERVLEYGCGTGRFTTLLAARCSELLAVDLSLQSLRRLAEKLSRASLAGRVGLVWADVARLPLAPGRFDLAFSAQLLEHLVDPADRRDHLAHARAALRPGGRLVATVYHHDLRRRLKSQTQDGRHPNGLPYHYFTAAELRREVAEQFDDVRTFHLDTHWPLEARFRLPGQVGGWLSQLGSALPLVRQLSHLLLVESAAAPVTPSVHYRYPSRWWKVEWHWFTDPHDVAGADVVNFFSYSRLDVPGFKRKAGLSTCLDLTRSQDELWANARHGFIQKQIERGRRHGIAVANDRNFTGFTELYRSLRRRKRIARDNPEAFKNGILFSAYLGAELLAGGVFMGDGESLRAWALASRRLEGGDGRSREVIGWANRMVIWEAVRYGQAHGYRTLDLGGISPDSADPAERSLAEFKEAFGGQRREAYFYYKVYSPTLRRMRRLRTRLHL